MRIENEMLSRFSAGSRESVEQNIGTELDFFFDNVLETVVDYFKEEETV